MEHTETDPYNVAVSDLNERKQNIALFEAFVGQRRIMAAQQVDLDTVPVRIADWDDFRAIKASVTENVDEFQSSVHPDDRALALKRMAEKSGNPDAL